MTKYGESGEFFASRVDGFTVTPEGSVGSGRFYTNENLSDAEARERLGSMHGVDAEDVVIPGSADNNPKHRKLSVAFSASRWRASWDPKAQKGDPSLN